MCSFKYNDSVPPSHKTTICDGTPAVLHVNTNVMTYIMGKS